MKLFNISLICVIGLFLILVNFAGNTPHRETLIDGDGKGYYAYLPSLLLYGSLDFSELIQNEFLVLEADQVPHYFIRSGSIFVNKYTAGTALFMLPFFLLAILISMITGLPLDGYSLIFQYSAGLAAAFWLFLGLKACIVFLKLYDIKISHAFFITIAGLLATNLFCYAFVLPSLSHLYAFTTIAIFVLFLKKFFLSGTRKFILLAALFYGLTILIRPVNAIAIFIVPFIAGDYKTLILRLTELNPKTIIVAIGVVLIAILPQILINLFQTGHPLHWSYTGEGFYFRNPQIGKFLISFRKGWLIYTPLALLIIPGLFLLLKRSKHEFVALLGFFLLIIYIFSSWWNWYYGDSFGMRPMIDFYVLLILVIGILYSKIRRLLKAFMVIYIAGCIFLNLFQTYQYAEGIIHPDSMNKVNYKYVFLKTGDQYKHIIGNKIESYYGRLSESPIHEASNDMESQYSDWDIINQSYSENAFEGKFSYQLDSVNRYSPGYILPIVELSKQFTTGSGYVIFKIKYFEPYPDATLNSMFVFSIVDGNKQIAYESFSFKSLPDSVYGIWRNEKVGFKIPDMTGDIGTMKFYIWNKEGNQYLIDDMEIKIYNILIN